jgi:PAS domain S-box-containing protein
MAAEIPSEATHGSGPFDLGDGFRRFADHVPLMMWRTDHHGRSVYHNESWLQFTGRSLDDELDDGWRRGLHPDDFERHARIVAAAFEARIPFTIEYRLRRHDGAYRWLLDTGRPLQDSGQFHGYLGSCFDITDRKNAEEESARALIEKETLLAEIYHRVRNNLQVMVSLIGLYGRAAPEACRGSFDALGQRVRAIALVQQHLHEAPHIASIDLRDYLRRLASGLGSLRRPGRIGVMVEGAGTSLVEPRSPIDRCLCRPGGDRGERHRHHRRPAHSATSRGSTRHGTLGVVTAPRGRILRYGVIGGTHVTGAPPRSQFGAAFVMQGADLGSSGHRAYIGQVPSHPP